MKKFSGIIFAAIILIPVVVLAQVTPVATTQQWWVQILNHLLGIAAVVFAGIIAALSNKLAALIAKWFHISNSTALQNQIQGIAATAITYAEKLAASELSKAKPATADDKVAAATKFALEQMDHLGLEAKAEDYVTKHIISALGAQPPAVAAKSP